MCPLIHAKRLSTLRSSAETKRFYTGPQTFSGTELPLLANQAHRETASFTSDSIAISSHYLGVPQGERVTTGGV